MSISAAQVKELRELTGAGMMDCKAALAETDGDMEAAVDWLRKKGISKADKKAGRTAAEGLIGVDAGLREAVVVEVNSETDFVARNEAFQQIVRNVAKVALAFGGKTETVAAAKYPGSDKSVTDAIKDAVGTIGENLGFRRSARLGVEHGAVATYVHNAVADNLGKLGVLVAIETAGKAEAAHAFARQVAMHVAATNPLALTPDELDPAVIAARARDLLRPGAPVGQAGSHHREDGRGPPAQVLRGSRAAEAGLRAQPRPHRREGAEGSREGYRRTREDHRLPAIRARRGDREGNHRLCGRGRGGGEKVTLDQALLRFAFGKGAA